MVMDEIELEIESCNIVTKKCQRERVKEFKKKERDREKERERENERREREN